MFYILISGGRRAGWGELICTVYVKDGDYFIQQGGLKEEWGKNWIRVYANSIDHARGIGEQMFKSNPSLYMKV